ncbi:uncharacterized protein A1O9_01817 [Exophiala aquamarina CBS 119918]|uniref:Uncharacterized protein n=1 Tax=Exophiala aquamarina CBS 119918 TaxID=1182545 RepID=A0A072PUU6_9EURO|nr:uncharacterized protein A1O9_01817 [Exophiala aquamarina CBS 119918]KEF63839.1 hypothetical protein A1O9_01817 [Exophiala aquamarina CBS 119918]
MSRSRETTKSIRKLESIEEQNRLLCEEKILSEARLEEAENAQRQLSAKQAIADQYLDTFKEKYYKLKNWALEANKDCEILQNKSINLRQSLAELTNERDDLRARLQDLDNVQQKSLGQMDRMRGLVNDVRQLAIVNIADFNRKDGVLQAKCEHLRREQARCEKLEAHIAQIGRHKTRQDQRFHDDRDRQNKSLREIFSELTRLAVKDAGMNSESKEILESVKACQVLLKDESTFGPKLAQIKNNIESVTELVSSRLKSAVGTLREDVKDQIAKSLTTAETEKSREALQASNAELVKTKEEAARLAHTIEHSKVIIELLRNGKQVAEDREAYLKNNTEKLIEALSEGRGIAQKQFNHLKDTNDALQTKCQAANAKAAEYKVQNDDQSGQIKLLETQRDELQKEKDNIAWQFRNLMEEMILFKETTSREMNEKASQSKEQICKLRADLDEQTRVRQQIERESTSMNEQFSKVQEELKKSQSTSTLALREKNDIEKRLAKLQQGLSRAQEDVRLRDQMQLDLATKSAEINDLKKSQYQYEQVKQELVSQNEAVFQKTQEAKALASQVQSLQNHTHKLEQKAQERDIFAEGKAHLERETHGLRQKLDGMQHLRGQLEDQNAQLEESQSALNKAKDDLSRMRKLEEENKSLKDTLESMSAELTITSEGIRELDAFRHLLSDKEEKIRRVEEELATYTSKSEEFVKSKAALKIKENELLLLRDRLSAMETEETPSKPTQPIRRAANRSAQNSSPNQSDSRPCLQFNEEEMSPIQATGLTVTNALIPPQMSLGLATSSQSFVADTQPEIQETLQEVPDSFQPQRQDLETLGLLDSGDTSSLSDIANPFERDEYLGDERIAYLEEPGTSLPSSQGGGMGARSTARVESTTQPPPSSSYGSLNEQMLLDISPHTELQLETTTPPRRLGFARKPQPIRTDRRDIEVERNKVSIQRGSSELAKPRPERLNSEFQTKQQQTRTAKSPVERPETPRDREATPSVARERYRPNSAAKRKMGQV